LVGSFGRVLLSKNKKNGEFFAMKRLKKADIIKLRQVDHVISENTILADIDHPLLVSLQFYSVLNFFKGWIERIRLRLKIPVFLDAIHSRR
jgi:serine/threonine protein kinase